MSLIRNGRTTWVYWLIDYCSAARPRIREIERDGEQCKMELLREFANRQDAFELEYELVCRLPNLLNRDQRKYVLYQARNAA